MNSNICFVCKVFGIVFVGLLGAYFMCSGHNYEQAILKNAKICFEEALQEEKKKLEGEVARVTGKLSNEGFVSKAPEKVIAAEKEKKVMYEDMLAKVKSEDEGTYDIVQPSDSGTSISPNR